MRDPVDTALMHEEEKAERYDAIAQSMSTVDRREIACELLNEYLGKDDEYWEELCADLSTTEPVFAYFCELFRTNRKKWFNRMLDQAELLWEEKIIDLYVDQCQ